MKPSYDHAGSNARVNGSSEPYASPETSGGELDPRRMAQDDPERAARRQQRERVIPSRKPRPVQEDGES